MSQGEQEPHDPHDPQPAQEPQPAQPAQQESRLDRTLRGLGLQPRPFRALLTCLVLMDLRSVHYARATGGKPEEPLPPLFWVTGQLLLVSFLACALLLGRVDARAFALCGLALAALCSFSAVAVGFDEVAFDPRDRLILGPRPLSARTYAAARLTNLGGYVALLSAALTICPALSGAFLRDAGSAWIPCYALASGAVCLASAAAAILLLLAFAGGGRRLGGAKAALAWVQVGLFALVAYGGQFVLRGGGGAFEEWAASPPAALTYTPWDWLARSVAWAAWDGPSGTSLGALALAWAAALGLSYAALLWLSKAYLGMASGPLQVAALPRPAREGTLAGRLSERLLGRAGALGLWWISTHFRRDPGLRLRTWPLLSLALAAGVLGVLSEHASDPFLGYDARSVTPLVALGLIAAALPQVCLALRSGEDPDALWLFESAPLNWPRFMSGVRLGLLTWTAYPLLGALGLIYAWVWRSPLHALLALLPAWAVCELSARWCLLHVLRGHPFRRAAARGEALQPAALPSALVTAAAGAVASAQFFAAPWPMAYALLLGALLVAIPLSEARARRGWARLLGGAR